MDYLTLAEWHHVSHGTSPFFEDPDDYPDEWGNECQTKIAEYLEDFREENNPSYGGCDVNLDCEWTIQ